MQWTTAKRQSLMPPIEPECECEETISNAINAKHARQDDDDVRLGDLGPNGHDDDVMTMGGDGGDDDVNDDAVS